MKAKCTNCPAEVELGVEGEDIGDTAYKLLCPVLREHLAKKGHDVDIECPYMQDVKKAAALRRLRAR
jgi:hypothetical protein